MTREQPRIRRCDGVTRREILHVGGLTAFGLTLGNLSLGQSQASAQAPQREKKRSPACILIWLDGGPSHLETFDLKPDAPKEVRGPFQPTSTKVPGIHVCEYMPRTAQVMQHVALIRSMTSNLGEHNFGSHYLLTGYKPNPALRYPSFGSVVAQHRSSASHLPPYVAVPRPNVMAGEGYLPSTMQPFAIHGDPSKPSFQVKDLHLYAGVTGQRLNRRRDFLTALDGFSEQAEQAQSQDPQFEQAYRMVSSPSAKKAFDLQAESKSVRQRYGMKPIGQSCLLARRLIEAGVHFVTVTDRGWDTHNELFNRLKEGYTGGSVGKIPSLDLAYSALLEDLSDRGMLDDTLVIVMGEFGRTPKLNTSAGRDHWPRAFSVALAGGGIRGGQVIGRSDSRGESPAERPVTPSDLACTIYHHLGIDPETTHVTSDGRPVMLNQGGKRVQELAS